MKKQILIITTVNIFLLLVLSISVYATSVTTCQTISSSDTYILQNNIISNGTCINITGNNVIFNGNGYNITSVASVGIDLNGGNITINNTSINSYGSGIRSINSSNDIIINNVLNSSASRGVYFNSSLDDYFSNNIIQFQNTSYNIQTVITKTNLIHGFLYADGYVFASTVFGATHIPKDSFIKLNPDNLSDFKVVNVSSQFITNIAEITYDSVGDEIYGVSGTGNVFQINPITFNSITEVVNRFTDSPSVLLNSITNDGTFLYTITYAPVNSTISKYRISDFSLNATVNLTGLSLGHNIKYDNVTGYLYATGNTNPAWIAKINTTDLSYINISMPAFNKITDDMAMTNDYLWVGSEGGGNELARVNKSDLTYSYINITEGGSYGVMYDGIYIWNLNSVAGNNLITRIDPNTLQAVDFPLITSAVPNEIVSNGTYLFYTTWNNTAGTYISPTVSRIAYPSMPLSSKIYQCDLNNNLIWTSSLNNDGYATSNPSTNSIGFNNLFLNSANSILKNQNILSYNISSNNVTIQNSNGAVNFNNINGTGTDLFGDSNSDVQISNNFAYVNSSQTGLNQSANVVFYNISFTPTIILRDGVVCPSGICSSIINLGGKSYGFSVSGWSNSIRLDAGSPSLPISSCSDFTKTMTYLIPGFLALAVLIAGGVVFALGFQKNDLKIMLVSFIIILLGITFVAVVANLAILTC